MTEALHPSYYAASAHPFAAQPPLDGDITVDVCVIGAGITGLTAALDLAERGYKVVIVEGERVGWGASGRSGGQFIHDYACGTYKLEKFVGKEDAAKHWQISVDATALIKDRVKKYGIQCDLHEGYATVALKERQRRDLIEYQELVASRYDYLMQLWEKDQLRSVLDSDKYVAGLFDPLSGHLHPLNYTLGLAEAALKAGVRIAEQTRATRIEKGRKVRVHTARGIITCHQLVLGANCWLGDVVPELDRKIMPVGTYIMATEPLGKERAQSLIKNNMGICDSNFVLDYFRLSADYRMLFGGRVSYSGLTPVALTSKLYSRMIEVFPQLDGVKADHTWGGFVDITMNRAPHFGRLDNNIYFAQGFSGHGIALTGMAGRMMADAIQGQSERFDLFDKIKHRDFPGGRAFRTPALVLAMAYFRMRDWLP